MVEAEVYSESKTCKCCDIEYAPSNMDFYSLCHACFGHFNLQKMRGRFGQVLYNSEPDFYTENSDEWVKSGRCTHKFDSFDLTNGTYSVLLDCIKDKE